MALCLVSCGLPYCKKTHLSEEEMEWINIYGKKENILFSLNYLYNFCNSIY